MGKAARASKTAVGGFAALGAALVAAPLVAERSLAATDAHLVTRVALVAAAALTTVACAGAAVRARRAVRRGWLLLSLTALCWAATNGVAAWSELAHGRVLPVPSPADVPAAIAVVLGVLAVLSFLGASLSSAARMRTLLDGLLIASSLLFAAWALVLGDLYASTGEGPGRVLALGYPISDLALMGVLLLSLTRVRFTRPWVLLLLGITMQTVGHTAFAYLAVAREYAAGLEGVSWIAGCVLIAGAAFAGRDGFEPRRVAPRGGTRADVLVPCIPLALCAAIAARQLSTGPLDTFLLVNAGVIVVLLVSRQLLAQLEYLDLHRELEASVMHAMDVMTVVDPDLLIRYQSGASERMLGRTFGELVGTPLMDLVHPNGRKDLVAALSHAPAPPEPPMTVELLLHRPDGEWVLTETTIANLIDHPDVRGYLCTSRDLGQRKALTTHLDEQTLSDPLTGLANRMLFIDRVRHAVARSARHPETLGVMVLDLDGFKQVNDTLGHAAGDQVLVEVARRLGVIVRKGDTLARLGADEFGILLEAADEESPASVAQRVQYALRAPVRLGGRSFVVGSCIGFVGGGSASLTAEDLIRSADLALTEARAAGRGSVAAFTPEMQASARRRVEVESELRQALDNDELTLAFQPIVELDTGRISGAEALVRWTHAERGLVPPSEFVAIAEESELALRLGRWVLNEACSKAHRLQNVAEGSFSIGVNLSARQLESEWLVGEVRAALHGAALEPSALVLEIPEGVLATDSPGARAALEALHSLGVRIAIDDFGTGWSSLSRLRSFPVDKLKIDRPFIAEIRTADDEAPMVSAIVAMAHSLGVATVAEGVQTAEQLTCLYRHGCREAQGYGVYRPLPVDELERLLTEHAEVLRMIAPPLSPDAQSYADVVKQAAAATAPLEQMVPPLLNQLVRITGADAAYVAELDVPQLVEWLRFAAGNDNVRLPVGMVLPLDGSPAAVAFRGGSAHVPDLQLRAPAHPLSARSGVRCLLAVPIPTADGTVYGTLCAVSARALGVESGSEGLLELFARLLGDHPEVRRAAEKRTSTAMLNVTDVTVGATV